MRDLTISEMEMVFGGATKDGSGTNGSAYGPHDPNDVLNDSPSYPQGSAGSNPSLNTGKSVPLGGGATAQEGYYGSPSHPTGGGVRITIPF